MQKEARPTKTGARGPTPGTPAPARVGTGRAASRPEATRFDIPRREGRTCGLDKDLGSAAGGVLFYKLSYGARDLLAALRRRFDRVGVIAHFGADQAQVQQG